MAKAQKRVIKYFKMEDKVVLPASISKRFGARMIDFLLAGLVGKLILSIYAPLSTPYPPSGTTESFSNFIPNYYDPVMMTGWALMLFGMITFLFVLPLLNFKNPGQTFGKRIFRISPMYLTQGSYVKSFLLRESLVSGMQVLFLTFILIMGTDPSYLYSEYITYYKQVDNAAIAPISYNQWYFISAIWTNEAIMGTMTASIWQVTLAYFAAIFRMVWIILLVLIIFTVVIMKDRRGIHDIASGVAIVDLKTVQDETNLLSKYQESTMTLNPTISEFGPPVKLKKKYAY